MDHALIGVLLLVGNCQLLVRRHHGAKQLFDGCGGELGEQALKVWQCEELPPLLAAKQALFSRQRLPYLIACTCVQRCEAYADVAVVHLHDFLVDLRLLSPQCHAIA